ncbi:VanZ family protein [Paenibacillus sp. CN-4]|uniref:VanZ family protein n=1 Tax=Paenibacillus nanchangensis TaxID=3348343 RepID=UPI00397BFFCB
MKNKTRTKEKSLRWFIYGLFILYIILLLRVTLFKQASLYHLFAAVGASERTISIIPFQSILEMVSHNISLSRILENVCGNVIAFIPWGLLTPIILKRERRSVLAGGITVSASIELLQLVFGLGSTDIDDLIFNTLGVVIGYLLFRAIQKRSKSIIFLFTSIITMVLVSGGIAVGILLVHHTELFIITPKEMTIANGDLVQSFIETPAYLNGKYIKLKDSRLTVEKSIQTASEQRKLMDFKVTSDSRIYIRYEKIDYFFSTIVGEHYRYERITYSDFVSQRSEAFSPGANVIIWSSDGQTVDYLVVVKWAE